MNSLIITVSQLNRYAHALMEEDKQLSSVFVKGEISNLKEHYASGHLYFTLKDENSSIRSVMFRGCASKLRFRPQDGMSVICHARADIWERDGQFQLYVNDMQPDGVGALALEFQQTKEKLEKEGLFSQELKRPIKQLPKIVAVVTSDTGAAVQDIVQILARRNPMVRILLCPVLVQGRDAVSSMLKMLERLYKRKDVDTVIIGRGGGSAEDLSCFNDEMLARTIRRSPFPVISAVGHETDYTICDFVADLRAATPSAAAELVSIDIGTLRLSIDSAAARLVNSFSDLIEQKQLQFSQLATRQLFQNKDILTGFWGQLDSLRSRLLPSYRSYIQTTGASFGRLVGKLDTLSPLATLSRGYAAVYRDNDLLTDTAQLKTGDNVAVRMRDGQFTALVTDTQVFEGRE